MRYLHSRRFLYAIWAAFLLLAACVALLGMAAIRGADKGAFIIDSCSTCPTLPPYPNALQTTEARRNADMYLEEISNGGRLVSFSTTDSMEVVQQFYVDALMKDGWHLGSDKWQLYRGPQASPEYCVKPDMSRVTYRLGSSTGYVTHVLIFMFNGSCPRFGPGLGGDM